MKDRSMIMTIVTVAFFLVVAGALLILPRFVATGTIIRYIISIAIGLIILWFVVIGVVIKREAVNSKNREGS